MVKMLGFRDVAERILEEEMSKVCADTDRVIWDIVPDTVLYSETDEETETRTLCADRAMLLIVMVCSEDGYAPAQASVSLEPSTASDEDEMRGVLQQLAENLSFERMAIASGISET